ncbi:MAG: YceI family protein [Bacteroidia bacterium]
MKKTLIILTVAATFAACNNAQTSETKEQAEVAVDSSGVSYSVDNSASMLNWNVEKLVGGHQGTVVINGGSFNVKDGNVTSGNFTFDMSTIVNTDLEDADMNAKLVGHLKSPDFFNIEEYPTGKFEVTSSEVLSNDPNGNTHSISGNLTIKDSVKNITFPIKVSADADVFTAEGSATINRLNWGIVYNSVSASPAELLKKIGDSAIKDEINITFNLKANKQ